MKNFEIGNLIKFSPAFTNKKCGCYLCNKFIGILFKIDKENELLYMFIKNRVIDIDYSFYWNELDNL